jgi:hypothetical protein
MDVMYYASKLQCWQLVCILVKTSHPCLSVGCHIHHHPPPHLRPAVGGSPPLACATMRSPPLVSPILPAA